MLRKFGKISRFWFYSMSFVVICCLALVSIWQPDRNVAFEKVHPSKEFRIFFNKSASVGFTLENASLTSTANTEPSDRTTKSSNESKTKARPIKKAIHSEIASDLKPRLPQCLIVGVRKAGTRALLEYLSLHPSIVASKKETHFFDSDENFKKGLSWYLKFMPLSLSGQITIEKTPAYFLSHKVPPRIRASLLPHLSGKIKFLVVVKDPIERALSDYVKVKTSKTKLGIQYLTFEELSTDPITGNLTSIYKPIIRSLYSLQLKNWLKYFEIDEFKFVSGETLITNPASELEGVERFLGIPRYLTREKFLWNETRGFFCMVFNNICSNYSAKNREISEPLHNYSAHSFNYELPTSTHPSSAKDYLGKRENIFSTGKCRGKRINFLRHQAIKDSNEIKCLSPSKGLKHPTLDANFLRRLKAFFDPYNRDFYRMTGIDFGW